VDEPPDVEVAFDELPNDGPPGEGDTVAGFEQLLTRPAIDLSADGDPTTPKAFDRHRGDWIVDAANPSEVKAELTLLGPVGVEASLSGGSFLLQSGSGQTAIQLHGGDPGHGEEKSACAEAEPVDRATQLDQPATEEPRPPRSAEPERVAHAAWHAASRRLLIRLGLRRRLAFAAAQPPEESVSVIAARVVAELGPGDEAVVADGHGETRVQVRAGSVSVEDCVRRERVEVGAGKTYQARGGLPLQAR
jgi:hypothetical protein